MRRLTARQAGRVIGALADASAFSSATGMRLGRLLNDVGGDGLIPLDRALATLYPETDPADALERFRKWRAELHRTLGERQPRLRVEVDRERRSPPERRACWFAGEPASVGADRVDFGRYTDAAAADAGDRPTIAPSGRELTRPRYAYAYHASDRQQAEAFVRDFEPFVERWGRAYQDPIVLDDGLLPGQDACLAAIDLCLVLLGVGPLDALPPDRPEAPHWLSVRLRDGPAAD